MRAPIVFALLAAAGWGAPSRAQEPLSAGDKSVANFAFATQLGSGIYSIDGRTIQIYRLPLSYRVRPESEESWGLKVTFPMTIGFYDFEPIDVLDTGLPENLDTVSLVPGLEFRVPVRRNLLLKPFFEAGIAREGSADTSAWVYSFGLRSLAGFPSGGFDVALGNGLVWAGVEPDGGAPADRFAAFYTSVHARHAMGFEVAGHEPDYGLYASIDLYLDEPDFPLPEADGWDLSEQYEAGVTFGTREPIRLWKIELPRLGIGYRFGSEASAFRVVIGTPALVLKR